MKDLLVFALTALGMIYVITQSAVGSGFRILARRWLKSVAVLFYCPACFGFWVGVLLWLLHRAASLDLIEASFSGCALGALWSEYKVSESPWQAESGQ